MFFRFMPISSSSEPVSPHERSDSTVFVVDDEPALLDAVRMILETEGYKVRCFRSGREFLDALHPSAHGCVILDLCLPDCSGLDIQDRLVERGIDFPHIFLTGYGSVSTTSKAFRTGALDFLEKPFDSEVLLERVAEALARAEDQRTGRSTVHPISERYKRLSSREKQVLAYIVDGDSSKQMAKKMGISHRTVEVYRGQIMRKIGVETLVQLMLAVAPLFEQDESSRDT
ncbi:response regulator transcription factor [Methylolobus aquaticus]|nr:response regulator transcription factor [Methylolobus aquaticus]